MEEWWWGEFVKKNTGLDWWYLDDMWAISSRYHPHIIQLSKYHPHIIHMICGWYHPDITHISSRYHPHIVQISPTYHIFQIILNTCEYTARHNKTGFLLDQMWGLDCYGDYSQESFQGSKLPILHKGCSYGFSLIPLTWKQYEMKEHREQSPIL